MVTRIAVFVATRWELQALRSAIPLDTTSVIGGIRCVTAEQNGRLYCVIQTGVGPDRASKVARAVLSEGTWELVLSTGFACALASADVGDLIIGTEILSVLHDGQWIRGEGMGSCSRDEQIHLLSVGRETGLTVKTGRIVSTARVAWRADEKRAIRDLTDAVGLDMESAALAAVARDLGIPMAIARTVSDLVDEDLPLDFNLFLRPTGWLVGPWALIRHPSRFIELNRLRTQSRVAADRLADFFKGYAELPNDIRPATGELR
jgi:adenosylhomocysteine nucleosidase